MRGIFLGRIILGLITLTISSAAFSAEYLVKYKNTFGIRSIMTNSADVRIMDNNPAGQLLKVKVPDNKYLALVSLLSNPNIEYVVPNAKVKAFFAPIEATALKSQWAIAKVQAEKAWQRAGNKGNRKVLLAVIDTGVDYKHKNLAPNAVQGFNFIKNDNDPMDITSSANPGHGTHCAGIIGATGLIDGGTVGISPEVSIMPLRFLDENGSGDLNNGIKAIDYAIANHVDVISASWGAAIPRSQAQPLIDAVARAEQAGIVFVVAASNDGKNNDSFEVYPAKAGLSNVISVAASNSSDTKPSWSNYGRATVDLASPGDGITSTLPKDTYGDLSGTSMATPLVAGLVAFIKAQDPNLTPSQIRSLLQTTGAKVNIATACDCRIDAFAATDTVVGKKMFVSPAAATVDKGAKLNFIGVYGVPPFTYSLSNTAVAMIDNNGEFQAMAEGDTTVTVVDANGQTATSYKIYVGKPSGGGGNPPDPGNPPVDPGKCPIGDQSMCDILCQILPDAPFCKP